MPEKNKKSGGGGGVGGFNSLGLSPPILRGISRLGFRNPTPVQRKTLPIALSGTDVVVMARTGSGKTAAFLIPLLERLLSLQSSGGGGMGGGERDKKEIRGVILSPTRELSLQTLSVLKKLSQFINTDHDLNVNITCGGIHGGQSMEKQFELLASKPTILVATPGRLSHHLNEIPDFTLSNVDILILDEADRLFEMGFTQQIRDIVRTMPRPESSGRQTMLFSATMPKILVEFTKSGGHIMNDDPTVVRLDAEVNVSDELRIGFLTCRSDDKDAVLLHLLRDVLPRGGINNEEGNNNKGGGKGVNQVRGLTLVFAATRHHVEYLTNLINAALPPPAQSKKAAAQPKSKGKGKKSKKSKKDAASLSNEQPRQATMIYGTMDQEARQQSLSSFRSGQTPILVVTDVAARGIDVPLIDHVIHYAFPPNAKLFIHRSGRAARAGRIGWCWSLVDPEEMPYMVDLHLFLGRRLCNPDPLRKKIEEQKKNADPADDDDDDDKEKSTPKEYYSYTLSEMTPDMVHYGTIPESVLNEEVENVRRIVNSELSGGHDTDQLRSLQRVCSNAMKQYRKSRPEPSGAGLRRARDILEGAKDVTGRRGGGGSGGGGNDNGEGGTGVIAVHPLLRWVETDRLLNSSSGTTANTKNKKETNEQQVQKQLDSLRQREEFLRAMSAFRPKETIFETFGTGNREKKKSAPVSQVDKGRTTSKVVVAAKNKNDSSVALVAMRGMRRQMRMARDKGSFMVVAGSKNALALNGEIVEDEVDHENDDEGVEDMEMATGKEDYDKVESDDKEEKTESSKNTMQKTQKKIVETSTTPKTVTSSDGKRRMSKAERKRAKKSGTTAGVSSAEVPTNHRKTKNMRGSDFRDTMHFIGDSRDGGGGTINASAADETAENDRSRWVEMSMQPSASASSGTQAAALRMEEAMLDIVGDENADLVHRRRMMRWDKSKRKYVQTTVGEELGNGGVGGGSKKMRLESGQVVRSKELKLGDMYEKWQKKTNRSVGRVGVFDDVNEGDDGASDTNARFGRGGDDSGGKNKFGEEGADKKKSIAQIRKERKEKQNLKIKNMKKEDRRRLERRGRAKKTQAEANRPKGYQGKKGFSGRWGAVQKGKR